MPDLLRAEGIEKRYGGVTALRGAGFALAAGEAHALVGENGAGKSTLAKILAGSVRADAGRILIDEKAVAIHNPLDAQRLGIGIIYQELDLFPNLTIGENIVIGNLKFPESWLVDFRRVDAFCRPFLAQAGLDRGPRELVAALAIGQAQLVAVARALSMSARVILMDEPTSSLGEDAAARLFQTIASLKPDGVSIVYVSHKMDEIFRVCDRATVLRDGETAGVIELLGATPQTLVRMMVGRELAASWQAGSPLGPPAPQGQPLLCVTGLTTRKLRDVSFDLRPGEVLGLAGLVGAGRSELGAALFGLDRILGGEIRLRGTPVTPHSPAAAMRLGIGLLPEDRKLQGLMPRMSALENSILTEGGGLRRFGLLSDARERAAVEPLYRRLGLRLGSWSAPVNALSGGSQQKALLARWLLADPDVLFLDDPARGIDVGAKQDIYRIVAELAAAGKGVILVSSELPELLRCADRILVLADGRVAAEFPAAQATQERIMAAATGGRNSAGPGIPGPCGIG
jgi:ABC-type sugar transport system ATPase subunit